MFVVQAFGRLGVRAGHRRELVDVGVAPVTECASATERACAHVYSMPQTCTHAFVRESACVCTHAYFVRT